MCNPPLQKLQCDCQAAWRSAASQEPNWKTAVLKKSLNHQRRRGGKLLVLTGAGFCFAFFFLSYESENPDASAEGQDQRGPEMKHLFRPFAL